MLEGAVLEQDPGGLEPLDARQAACPPSLNWQCFSADYRESYLNAEPWPHLVVEGIFDPEVVIQAEVEETAAAHRLALHQSRRQVKGLSPQPAGPAARGILAALISDPMLRFLRDLTKIESLVADPTFFWAGLHAGPPGGFQSLHVDFRRHPVTRLFHRVNILLYLNTEWQYGGELELYTRDLRCTKRVAPIAGRAVIFETTSETYHAVAETVGAPSGQWRLALNSYFYSATHSANDHRRKLIRKPRRPEDPWHMGFGAPPAALTYCRHLFDGGIRNLVLR